MPKIIDDQKMLERKLSAIQKISVGTGESGPFVEFINNYGLVADDLRPEILKDDKCKEVLLQIIKNCTQSFTDTASNIFITYHYFDGDIIKKIKNKIKKEEANSVIKLIEELFNDNNIKELLKINNINFDMRARSATISALCDGIKRVNRQEIKEPETIQDQTILDAIKRIREIFDFDNVNKFVTILNAYASFNDATREAVLADQQCALKIAQTLYPIIFSNNNRFRENFGKTLHDKISIENHLPLLCTILFNKNIQRHLEVNFSVNILSDDIKAILDAIAKPGKITPGKNKRETKNFDASTISTKNYRDSMSIYESWTFQESNSVTSTNQSTQSGEEPQKLTAADEPLTEGTKQAKMFLYNTLKNRLDHIASATNKENINNTALNTALLRLTIHTILKDSSFACLLNDHHISHENNIFISLAQAFEQHASIEPLLNSNNELFELHKKHVMCNISDLLLSIFNVDEKPENQIKALQDFRNHAQAFLNDVNSHFSQENLAAETHKENLSKMHTILNSIIIAAAAIIGAAALVSIIVLTSGLALPLIGAVGAGIILGGAGGAVAGGLAVGIKEVIRHCFFKPAEEVPEQNIDLAPIKNGLDAIDDAACDVANVPRMGKTSAE